MGANFEIIATLKAVKDSDNFSAFEVKDFNSGWQNTRYRFNAVSGTNRFMLEIGGGKWVDDSKNQILTFSRAETGKKPEKMTVKWEDRKNPEVIEKVAGYRIYTCNLLTFDERKALEEEGKEDEAKKKNHQFLEKTEFASLVKRVIDSNKYTDAKFRILGTVEFQYSAKNNMFYRTLSVDKLYKVAEDTPCKAEMTLNAFYTEDAVDDESYDENKKMLFNCYTDHYFSAVKGNRFVPLTLMINGNGDEKAEKKANGFKKMFEKFDDEATVRKVGLVCDMIDGAESMAITYDDLDEDTRDNIDMGLIELEDAIKALGGNMMGNRITETRVKSLSRTSTKGSEPTVFTEDDLKKLPVVEETEEEVDVDIFADPDDNEDDDI
jgi:hypothetical protein